jgi:hypothetical protein
MMFPDEIEAELSGPDPPDTLTITVLALMMDTDLMVYSLKARNPLSRRLDVPRISNQPQHPLYEKMKHAFEWARGMRVKHGFPADPWPIPVSSEVYEPPTTPRRILWDRELPEIKEAHRLFHRFSREGMIPYSVGSNGEPVRRIHTFDPRAGEILFQVSGDGA